MKSLKFLLLAILIFSFTLQAQKRNKSKAEPQTVITDSMFHNLKFRNIGPFRGGRSVASTGVVGQPQTFYMGSVGGGVWKTTDDGLTWNNVSDGFFKTGNVCARTVPGGQNLRILHRPENTRLSI